MNARLISCHLAVAALVAIGCARPSFTLQDPTAASLPARAAADVRVLAIDADHTYRQIGIIEISANTYAVAEAGWQRVGAERGCHAVQPWAMRGDPWTRGGIYASRCLVAD